MKNILLITVSCLFLVCSACEAPSPEPQDPKPGTGNQNPPPIIDPEWSVPINEVFDGGPGKDGIPSVDAPQFTDVRGGNSFLVDEELVVGIKIGNQVKAYPHQILDWHEIVNDSLGGRYFALNYCPLTGTASAWDRELNGELTTFGVSGLLYNSNLIPYDRATNTNWSQLLFKGINGENKDQNADLIQVIETQWATWKAMYPQTQVMTLETGFNRRYDIYPYGSYKTNSTLLFPVIPENDEFEPKERFLSVIVGDFSRAYSFTAVNHASIEVRSGIYAGIDLAMVGSESMNFMVAYGTKMLDGTVLQLSAVQDELPIVMKDTEGNKWDVFGEAVSGPRKGSKLRQLKQTIGYWFAIAAFYPNPDVFN